MSHVSRFALQVQELGRHVLHQVNGLICLIELDTRRVGLGGADGEDDGTVGVASSDADSCLRVGRERMAAQTSGEVPW